MNGEDVGMMFVIKEMVRELFEGCNSEDCVHAIRRDIIDAVWYVADIRIEDLTNNG